MESSPNNNPPQIDLIALLERFFKALKRTWLIVLVLCLLGSGAFYLRSRISYAPRYQCRAIFSISSGYAGNNIFSSGTLYYDSSTAQTLASAFPSLLKTDYMKDMIQLQLGTDYINGSISASALADTNMLELVVTSSSPKDALDILNAVVTCYPQAATYLADNPAVTLLDAPVLPTQPINSFSAKSALLKGGLIGLVLGCGLTALLALLTQTVSGSDSLKQITNLPILASFPLILRKKRRQESLAFISAATDSHIAEALRRLRTKVRKQLSEKEGKVVLLTSTIPGEGKTTISTNLAISLSNEGYKVALLDADLRNQTIARLFHAGQNEKGLMYCLEHPDESVLDHLKAIPGTELFYLSGASTSKRHYTIDEKALRPILEQLKDAFDYVIIDTPPCSVVSDTTLLTRYADCVLYVVRIDYANRHQIQEAMTGLHNLDIPLSGCILNGTPLNSSQYGYYGYGYGAKGSAKYGYSRKK